jgi:hypothetical protein
MNFLTTVKKWWGVGTIDPERDDARMPTLLLWVERACILVVAIVSGIAVAAFGYLKASAYTDWEILRWLAAGLFFFLATAITDVGVKFFIQKGAYDFFAAFNPLTYKNSPYNWFQRAMQIIAWACMIAIVAGLFLFDYVSVNAVRDPVANMVKKENKLNQDSIRRAVDAQEQARIGAVVEAIRGIEIDIRQAERQIEATKQRVYQSEGALRRLAENGNGWAKGQISAKQGKAVVGLQSQLATLRQNKADLEAQRVKDLAYRSGIIAKTDSSVMAENAAIEGRNTSLVEGTSSLFIWMGFWAKCIAGLIRVLLVVMFMGGTMKDYNGDGKTDYKDVNTAAQMGFQTP